MENRPNRLINAALIAALGGSTACNTIKPILAEPSPIIAPPSQSVATETPFQPPTLTSMPPTETSIPTASPTETPAQKMEFGSFDLGKPFEISTTPDLMKTLGYVFTDHMDFSVDKPMEVLLPYIDDSINARFDAAAMDNSHGNPSIVFLTDVPNIVVEYVHSLEPHSPGEVVRILGSFAIKHPDKINEILGKDIVITPQGQNPITAEVVDIRTVSATQFESKTHGETFWGIFPEGDNVILLRTDRMGIPDNIRLDKTPGTHYMILISCQPADGDIWVGDPQHWAQESFHNTQNRTFLTLKIVNP